MKTPYLLCLLLGFLFCLPVKGQQIWLSNQATITFFSSTPVEDIKGTSKLAASALNLSTGEVLFKVKNTSFQFEKKLMQEHFNETYMESEKYPVSEFKGKIENPGIIKGPGSYHVRIYGALTVHGVTKNYSTQATLVLSEKELKSTASFQVKTADHQIKVPSLVIQNIAETIDVRIVAVYQPKTN